MKHSGPWVALALAAAVVILHPAGGRVAAQNQPDVQGLWRNQDTTLRVGRKGTEVRAEFVEIGSTGRRLGFKPGEVSFIAMQRGAFLNGEQVIRYGADQPCYREGRRLPVIGRLTSDGQSLALHNYTVTIGPDCSDTGTYSIVETLWQRTGR